MPNIEDAPLIEGVKIVRLNALQDGRGSFRETFRAEWFPQRQWDVVQNNCSVSQAGTLRGLHYHFHQVDYWYVPNGRLRAGLADIRPSSPTYKDTMTVEMGGDNDIGLFIPVGVAHGFYALTDVTLMYVVDNYYSGSDEHGVLWSDPELGINWQAESLIISQRDQQNPTLVNIPLDKTPS